MVLFLAFFEYGMFALPFLIKVTFLFSSLLEMLVFSFNLVLILGTASLLSMQDLLNTLMKLRDEYHYCLFCGCQVSR